MNDFKMLKQVQHDNVIEIFFFVLIFFSINVSYSQWVQQNSGTANGLFGVSFTDVNTGTAVGLSSTILRTTNGGTNWVSQPNNTGANLFAVNFLNSNTGIIAGENGIVSKTTNGGANWVNQTVPYQLYESISILDANTAFVCGTAGTIIKTTNGGTNWSSLTSGVSITLTSITFPNSNTGYSAGLNGTIIKTTNSGTTWQSLSSGTSVNLFAITSINQDTIYCGGEGGVLLKTTNAGNLWYVLSSGTVQRLVSISFPSPGTGSISGISNTILRTTNYGSTWIAQNSGISGQDFYGIIFPSSSTGYCVGSGGVILKTISGGFPYPIQTNLISPTNGATGIALNPALIWDTASSNAKTYSLQLGLDSLYSSPVIDTTGLVNNLLNVPAGRLNNSTQYFWHVRGVNAAGNGNWSASFRFTTIVTLPTAPNLLLPVNNAANVSLTPIFDWDSLSPANYYRIQVSSDSSFASSEVDVTGITVSNYHLISPPLTNNTRYYWRVGAANEAGTGPWSSVFHFGTIVALPPPPLLLSPPNNALNVSLTPALHWRDDISVKSYQLQLSADSTFSTTIIDTSGFAVSQVTVRSGLLTSVSRYHWRVRTTNSFGTGPWSVIFHFNTLLAAPSPPILLAPQNGDTAVSVIVTLAWQPVQFADSYRIQISTDSIFTTTLVNIGGLTIAHYTVQGGTLQNDTRYYWRVNATNSVGTSPYSTVWHFKTVISAPIAAPILLSPANGSTVNTLTPLLDWNDVFNAAGYKINIAIDSLFILPLLDTNIIPSQLQVPAGRLYGGTHYYWRVRGINNGGYGPWSAVWSFTTAPIGIKNISSEIPNDYKLYNNYPNPFNPSTTIPFDIPPFTKVEHVGFITLKIYNVLGQEIAMLVDQNLNPGSYEVTWNAANYPSGIYFYRLISRYFVAVKKMILLK